LPILFISFSIFFPESFFVFEGYPQEGSLNDAGLHVQRASQRRPGDKYFFLFSFFVL
jgi:hypothetical protein